MINKLILLLSLSIGTSTVFACDAHCKDKKESEKITPKEIVSTDNTESEAKIDLAKISKSFGHIVGKNLESLGFAFNIEQVIEGMQDAMAGKAPPMDENECVQAISLIQEETFKKLATSNLKLADEFLLKNKKESNITSLEDGKLQYRIEKEGTGEAVSKHNSPLIRYVGKFLDGKVFGASTEDEKISLEETIQGFAHGIVGMKEGEVRTLFIHPDLAYGTAGYLPPNSLLQFEIEVVKADMPKKEEVAAAMSRPEEDALEIALDDEREASEESAN